ncbi:MAG: hypothetical protein RSC84_03915 [Peptostreptococcaceae bacterium]
MNLDIRYNEILRYNYKFIGFNNIKVVKDIIIRKIHGDYIFKSCYFIKKIYIDSKKYFITSKMIFNIKNMQKLMLDLLQYKENSESC